MSELAVTTIRRFYAALGAGDAAAALGLLGAEIESHEASGTPYSAVEPYRGPGEVAERALGSINEDVAELSLFDLDFRDLGESVLVLGRYRGLLRRVRSPLDQPFAHLWRLAGSAPIEFRQYTDAAAFADALAGAPAARSSS